jgi:IS5 family transposase
VARATARQISFADIELMRQGVGLEPLLEAISKFLDRQHDMIERVRGDLVTWSEEASQRSSRTDGAAGDAA